MSSELYEERQAQFLDTFHSSPPLDLSALIIATGDWLQRLTGESRAVNLAMIALMDGSHAFAAPRLIPAETIKKSEELDWRDLWELTGDAVSHSLQRGEDVTTLIAFGDFGLGVASDLEISEHEGRLESLIASFRDFVRSIPKGWSDTAEMDRLLLVAECRFRLDMGKAVSAEHLAAITGLGVRSVRNLLAPSAKSGLHFNAEGQVDAEVAMRWLKERPDFKESLWKVPGRTEPGVEPEAEESILEDVVFVPVAADGTWFDPTTCHRDGWFTVGTKGVERKLADYRGALAELVRMRRPSWRRPNENGHWGIVRAQSWERKSMSELIREGEDKQ